MVGSKDAEEKIAPHSSAISPSSVVPASKTDVKRPKRTLSLEDFDAELDAEEERKRQLAAQGPPPELQHKQITALIPALRNEVLTEKPSVAQLLREDNFRVEGYKWTIEVPNPFSRQQLYNEREALLEYVRKALNHPAVLMDVVVVETSASEPPDRPMTEEEKRKKFHELNPAVRLLEETFNTQIDYGRLMAFEHHLDIRLQFKQQLETTREYIIPFVSRHARVGEGTRVLDVGCGTGGVCMAFAEAGAQTLGVDMSDTAIAVARDFCAERAGQMRFLLQNVYEFETDEKFDLIVFKDSIEHIPEQDRIIAHVKRYLAPGGKLFFGFPPWRMPFGGHQQVIRNSKFLSLLPYFHLLPKGLYRALIRMVKESPSIEAFLMETKDLGISTARFERIVKQTGYKITDSEFYLFNPIYRYKFGIRPRRQWALVKAMPHLRDFVTTGVYYLVEPA